MFKLDKDFMLSFQIAPEAPWTWPVWMRWLAYGLTAGLAGLLLWWLVFSAVEAELDKARADHARWRVEFTDKLSRASALPAWQARHARAVQRVQRLDAQLPQARDMDAVLSALSRAGQARGLRFELFRPGEVIAQQPYAQQSISLRVTGPYSDLLGFTADVARLPWLVSLHNFTLTPAVSLSAVSAAAPAADGALRLDALLRTLQPGAADAAALLQAPAPPPASALVAVKAVP